MCRDQTFQCICLKHLGFLWPQQINWVQFHCGAKHRDIFDLQTIKGHQRENSGQGIIPTNSCVALYPWNGSFQFAQFAFSCWQSICTLCHCDRPPNSHFFQFRKRLWKRFSFTLLFYLLDPFYICVFCAVSFFFGHHPLIQGWRHFCLFQQLGVLPLFCVKSQRNVRLRILTTEVPHFLPKLWQKQQYYVQAFNWCSLFRRIKMRMIFWLAVLVICVCQSIYQLKDTFVLYLNHKAEKRCLLWRTTWFRFTFERVFPSDVTGLSHRFPEVSFLTEQDTPCLFQLE